MAVRPPGSHPVEVRNLQTGQRPAPLSVQPPVQGALMLVGCGLARPAATAGAESRKGICPQSPLAASALGSRVGGIPPWSDRRQVPLTLRRERSILRAAGLSLMPKPHAELTLPVILRRLARPTPVLRTKRREPVSVALPRLLVTHPLAGRSGDRHDTSMRGEENHNATGGLLRRRPVALWVALCAAVLLRARLDRGGSRSRG